MNPLGVLSGAGSAVAGLASSLGGSILNFFGNRETNATNTANTQYANLMNLLIHQADNAFNKSERIASQNWNRDMWYEQQAYNTPAAQAARLRAAGINPANVLGGDSAGSVGSIASSQPASAAAASLMQVPQITNPFDVQSITAPLTAIADAALKFNQAEQVGIQNQTEGQRQMANLDNMIADTQKKMSDKNLSEAERKRAEAEYDNLLVQKRMLTFTANNQAHEQWKSDMLFKNEMDAAWDAHLESQERTENLRLANEIQRATGMRMAEKQLAMLDVQMQHARVEIGLINSTKFLADAQKLHEIEKKSETITRKLGLQAQNEEFAKTKYLIRQQLEADIRQKNAAAGLSEFGTSAGNAVLKLAPLALPFGGAMWKGYKYAKGAYSSWKFSRPKVDGNTITWSR